MANEPRFRIDKTTTPFKVILQCSNCEADIREIGMNEEIKVTRAYYCEECDDGVIHLNLPKDKEAKEDGEG